MQAGTKHAERGHKLTWMPVPDSLSPFTPLLAMMPLSRKTRKLTTQKATKSLAGVYQAGSVPQLSDGDVTVFVQTGGKVSTSQDATFSMQLQGYVLCDAEISCARTAGSCRTPA